VALAVALAVALVCTGFFARPQRGDFEGFRTW
jgi:hypothetical protein